MSKKHKVTFFIATSIGFKKTKGYPIKIDGFEEFEFVLHRPFLHGRVWRANWIVSERSTGQAIRLEAKDTPQEAISAAAEMLNLRGKEVFKTALLAVQPAPPKVTERMPASSGVR